MGKLILVRHGESHANRDRIFAEDHTPLTELGLQQAREVAERIASHFRPHAIAASPLIRARQTADVIGLRLGLAVEVVMGLEECDFGFLKGQSYKVYYDHIAKDPTFDKATPWMWTPAGGESTQQTADRVMPVLERLAARFAGKELLVVCHGMMMMAIWARLTGSWEGLDVPPNCAVLRIDHEGGLLRVPVLVEECLIS
jgi:broad specificity phosphatase PhoE